MANITAPIILDSTGQAIVTAINNLSPNSIESTIAPVETSTTASQAYAVDNYLYLDNVLYKVTTAIAIGGTIVTTGAGANVEATKVTDEMGGSGVPEGGTAGQIIIKNSATEGDASWQSLDSTPTQNSTKPATSGGIYTAVNGLQTAIDSKITTTTTDPGEGSTLATNSLLIVVEE